MVWTTAPRQEKEEIMDSKITPDDAGTWLEGSHGWHNIYRVVDLAADYGFTVPDEYTTALLDYRKNGHAANEDHREMIEGHGELADMATEYLNSLAPEGYMFIWDSGLILTTESDAEFI